MNNNTRSLNISWIEQILLDFKTYKIWYFGWHIPVVISKDCSLESYKVEFQKQNSIYFYVTMVTIKKL